MSRRTGTILFVAIFIIILAAACNVNPQPAAFTPMPTLAPAPTLTLAAAIQGGSSQAANPSGNGSAGTGNAAAGSSIFERNCTSCHGLNGEGGVGLTLRNDAFIANGDAPVIDTISTGRPGTVMPAWLMAEGGPLTADQILNVVAFLHTWQNVPVIPKATEAPPEPTETPVPAGTVLEPAKPSNEGGPGQAVSLTGNADRGKPLFGQSCAQCHGPQGVLGFPNPGSEDASVPPLNPIDSTMVNKDAKVYATNLDLFIEHGSVPAGDGPKLLMPSFGDSKMLSAQDIADIIAYIIQLNTP